MKNYGLHYLLILALWIIPLSHSHAQVMGMELMEGKDKVEINFDYIYGFIVVDLKISGILPMKFILDTGAEHVILFKKEISDVLGFQYDKRINLIGSDLEQEVFAYITRNIPLKLEDTPTVMRDLIVLEEDFLELESMVGEPIDGILGTRFFRGLVLDINYRKNRLTLYNSDTFEKPDDDYHELDLDIQNYKPYLPTKIITDDGTRIDTRLLVDTGSALPFLLFLHTDPSLTLPENVIRGNLGRGLGGDLEGYLGKVRYLEIKQGIYFSNIITNFQQVNGELDPAVYHRRNGLIGNPILSRFDIIIDIIKEKAFVKPRKNYNKSFEYDRSGLIIYAFGPTLDQYYVKDVIENSPAEEAGIIKGDIIKKVGILPADLVSLGTITRRLQKKEGKKVRFTLLRNGEKLRKTVVLRDLFKVN